MLCRKFKTVVFNKTTNSHVIYRPLVPARSFCKWFDVLSKTNVTSSKVRLLREFVVSRLLNGWARGFLVNTAARRSRRERGVRELFQYFRHVFFKPRRTHLLVTVTAAYKRSEEKPGTTRPCSRNIKDQEMEDLVQDLNGVEELSKATLFCENCLKRIVIDCKHPGVRYCSCKKSSVSESFDGWVPYMEAEDVVIWRKEYKPGGLYAYKVYGRYKHIRAEDFAMIQVDGNYRKVWDTAVASLSVVEREINGVKDQLVLHWEVLWPRLFANRDYVYLRRHKEFNVQSQFLAHKDCIFESDVPIEHKVEMTERPSVHSHAKRISMENDLKAEQSGAHGEPIENKVYVIVSRACSHPSVPETKNTIRVVEYWSHMVITTLNGPDEPGMEFVLTYYDEPAVGGLPTAITTWAMGRAGPAFLQRMRSAAASYRPWLHRHEEQNPEDCIPFGAGTDKVSFENDEPVTEAVEPLNEQDMESYKQGPEIDSPENKNAKDKQDQQKQDQEKQDQQKQEQSAQTEPVVVIIVTDSSSKTKKPSDISNAEKLLTHIPCEDLKSNRLKSPTSTVVILVKSSVEADDLDLEEEALEPEETPTPKLEIQTQPTMGVIDKDSNTKAEEPNALEKDDANEEKDSNSGRWWRYLYPFYYFV